MEYMHIKVCVKMYLVCNICTCKYFPQNVTCIIKIVRNSLKTYYSEYSNGIINTYITQLSYCILFVVQVIAKGLNS